MSTRADDGTAYDLLGPEGAPAVVLIHGLGLCRDSWQWTVPALEDSYRVVTYDLYGHGQSAKPPRTPDLRLFKEQLQGLMDDLGISAAAIIGFSLGGLIARRFAQDARSRTRCLAILNSPHARNGAAQKAIDERVKLAKVQGPAATVEAALERWFTPRFRQNNPDVVARVGGWVRANDADVYHQIYEVLANGVDEVVAPEPPIRCPTLVMSAQEDEGNNPHMARAIAAEIEGSETVILPSLRHMALAEEPHTVNPVIRRFLDAHMSTDTR